MLQLDGHIAPMTRTTQHLVNYLQQVDVMVVEPAHTTKTVRSTEPVISGHAQILALVPVHQRQDWLVPLIQTTMKRSQPHGAEINETLVPVAPHGHMFPQKLVHQALISVG
jgi:hypothetical protein